MTVAQLGLGAGGRALVTIDPNQPTLLAYELMLREGVSGAAVVGKGGELIANLSTSDLRWAGAAGAAGARAGAASRWGCLDAGSGCGRAHTPCASRPCGPPACCPPAGLCSRTT
jgi:hypothetical protein